MEIALGGIIILIILLPGICFRKGYFSGEFSNQYTIRDFFQLFINTLFPSVVAYFVFLPIIYFLFGYYYDIEVLLGLLTATDSRIDESIQKIDDFALEILLFQIIINTSAFGFGYLFKDFVVGSSLDAKNKFFRYKNIWHYLLSAKFILFKRSQFRLERDKIEDIDIIFVDALLVLGELCFLYTGILVDYELSTDGSLDLIYLKDAQRKQISPNVHDTYKDIDGHIIILKYSKITNLNLSFIQVTEIEKNTYEFRLIE